MTEIVINLTYYVYEPANFCAEFDVCVCPQVPPDNKCAKERVLAMIDIGGVKYEIIGVEEQNKMIKNGYHREFESHKFTTKWEKQ